MQRRTFLTASAAAFAASNFAGRLSAADRLPIKKAVWWGMLPKDLSIADRFKLGKDTGFEQVELPTTEDPKDAEEMKRASEAERLPIHSVMNQAHWRYPLSADDPQVVKTSMDGMETSLRNAKLWGAETVLLVPAVVDGKVSYKEAYTRSQEQIRKLIPLAGELKVIIAVENVWNKFLLSPLEFARYVDEFKSPWVKAYCDVGNMVLFGYPQDWIRTLGPRIVKLHFKDFAFKDRNARFVNLRDGEIDWKAIYDALKDVGYKGTATVELSGGDKAYLSDVAQRVDMILTRA